MYIAIFEDGEFRLVESVNDFDFQSVDAGILDLIDVSVANAPLYYEGSVWHPIPFLKGV